MSTNEREASISELIEALRLHGDLALASRLWCCQRNRFEKAEAQRAGLESGWPSLCRSPACLSCCKWLAHGWRKRAGARFADADSETCSFVTIMLARTGDLDAVGDVVANLRVAVRNLRDRRARESRRWSGVSLYGLVELDALHVDDLRYLPPKRRAVIEALPSYSFAGDVVWVPHLHASVHHPRLHYSELRDALVQQWTGPTWRVDVRPFSNDADASLNAAAITSYAAKASMRTTLSGSTEMPWPLAWQARYWSWLCGLRRGLEPLRVRMGSINEKQQHDAALLVEPVFLEPMAVLF